MKEKQLKILLFEYEICSHRLGTVIHFLNIGWLSDWFGRFLVRRTKRKFKAFKKVFKQSSKLQKFVIDG